MLEYSPLSEFLNAYREKYPKSNPIIPLKGLIYFEEIDFEIENPILIQPITFKRVKKRLIQATKLPDKIFS